MPPPAVRREAVVEPYGAAAAEHRGATARYATIVQVRDFVRTAVDDRGRSLPRCNSTHTQIERRRVVSPRDCEVLSKEGGKGRSGVFLRIPRLAKAQGVAESHGLPAVDAPHAPGAGPYWTASCHVAL
jgi:hypothetical protein